MAEEPRTQQWLTCSCTEAIGIDQAADHMIAGHTVTQHVHVAKPITTEDVVAAMSSQESE